MTRVKTFGHRCTKIIDRYGFKCFSPRTESRKLGKLRNFMWKFE